MSLFNNIQASNDADIIELSTKRNDLPNVNTTFNNIQASNDADIIKLSTNRNDLPNVNITIASELMKNHQLASPLDPTGNIEVVQDNQGWPMIFTIGTDSKFYLMKQDSLVTGGYSVINLSDGMGDGLEATTFSITQDNKGRISINLAMTEKNGSETTVFSAAQLSNSFEETDWEKFPTLARKVDGVNAAFKVERMLMSAGDDGKAPVSIIAGSLNGFKYYYLLNSTGKAVKYEFPEDVKQHPDALKDMAIGYAFGQTGIYFIYDIGKTQTLACTTLADAELGSLSYDYSPGNIKIPQQFRNLVYNCISTPTGSKTKAIQICSDLFIGSPTGVYLFKNAAVSQCHSVTEKIKDVHELTIRQDKDNIVVWASTAGNKLYYIYGKKVATEVQEKGRKVKDYVYEWNDPILFKDDVVQIAPIRNTTREGNELYLVTGDKSIQHYWQDGATTLWKQQVINVPDQNEVIEFNSYTTHLHFEDDKGKSLAGEKVRITASEWTYVIINGFVYSLDQHASAEVSIDIMGNVTIITMTDDIDCPVYHLTADWLDNTLNIYSNGKITKGLSNIKSADDLKNARTADGKTVLADQSFDNDTLAAVANNISQLAEKGNELKNNTSNEGLLSSSTSGQYTFTAVERKGVLHNGRLAMNKLPDNFRLTYGDTDALALVGSGDFFDVIKSAVGDGLRYLEEFVDSAINAVKKGYIELKNGVRFILQQIDEGLQFVLSIGDKVLNIVLDTLGAVFKALNWVLKLIGIDLEKILEWLGRIIGWTDVLETSDKLCELINNGFDMIACTSNVMRDKVADVFRQLELAIADEDIVNRLGDVGKSNRTDGRMPALQDPGANLCNYHLIHSKPATVTEGSKGEIADAIEQAFKDLISDGILTGQKTLSMIGELFENISTDTIGQSITRLMQIMAVAVLEEVKHGLMALLSISNVLIKAIKALVNLKMNIPILGGLLKPLLGGRELTILRVTSIVIALPLRIIYRLATGDAFPHGQLVPVNIDTFNEMLKEGQSESPRVLTSQANPIGLLSSDEQGSSKTSALFVFGYEITRFCEMLCGLVELGDYLSGNDRDEDDPRALPFDGSKPFSIMRLIFTALATYFSHANLIELMRNRKDSESNPFSVLSVYEISFLFLEGFLVLASGIGKFLSRDNKKYTRGICMGLSIVLIVILSIEFGLVNDKTRAENLRFTSNLFLNLYKSLLYFPARFEGNPKAVMGICAAGGLMGATHLALIGVRYKTDDDDNVTFKFV